MHLCDRAGDPLPGLSLRSVNGVKAPLACVSIADMFKQFVEVILLEFLVRPQLSVVDTESFVGELW